MMAAWDVTGRVPVFAWATQSGETGLAEFPGRKAAEVILAELQARLRQNGEELTHLGVFRGPGSFTGIRAGLATALGLAAGGPVRVFGFTKFEVCGFLAVGDKTALVFPAGRNQYYIKEYNQGTPQGEARLVDPHNLPKDRLLIGPVEIPGHECRVFNQEPATAMLRLMQSDPAEEDYPLEPLYLRPADAKVGTSLLSSLLNKEKGAG